MHRYLLGPTSLIIVEYKFTAYATPLSYSIPYNLAANFVYICMCNTCYEDKTFVKNKPFVADEKLGNKVKYMKYEFASSEQAMNISQNCYN